MFHIIQLSRLKILTDLKLDSATITTDTYDTIEDTNVTYETVKEFGEEVANLVEGVTKISALEDKASETQAENFRKLILATSKDIRFYSKISL